MSGRLVGLPYFYTLVDGKVLNNFFGFYKILRLGIKAEYVLKTIL